MSDIVKSVHGEAGVYIVGNNGVTSIGFEYSTPEPYCTTDWYVVKKGDYTIARMNARYVALIEYFRPEAP